MDSVNVKGGGDLMSQITAALNATEIEVLKSAESASGTVAKEAVKALKQNSPKNKGKYAKGWTTKKEDGGFVVYNDVAPGLTHLLNNGHDIVDRNGIKRGHKQGDNHIGKVEKEMADVFVKDVQKELERRLGR